MLLFRKHLDFIFSWHITGADPQNVSRRSVLHNFQDTREQRTPKLNAGISR